MLWRRRSLWCIAWVLLVSAAFPASALAAPTVSYDGTSTTLTVTGEADAESFEVTQDGPNVDVVMPGDPADPDGAGVNCSASPGKVSCVDAQVSTVVVDGADGADTLVVSRIGGFDTHTMRGGDDNDTLTGSIVIRGTLDGGNGNDTLTANGSGYDVSLLGGAGDDVLNAGAGSLRGEDGGEGNDTFTGSDIFSDEFGSEPGSDTYVGGTKPLPLNPAPDFDPETAQGYLGFFDFGLGSDAFTYTGSEAITVTLDDQANDGVVGEGDNVRSDIEQLLGGPQADTLTAGAHGVGFRGNGGDDTLTGSPKNDWFEGGLGNDTLIGEGGDDYLSDGDNDSPPYVVAGGPYPMPAPTPGGNDRLDGGAGSDRLYGGRGADDISGGPGRDSTDFFGYVTQNVVFNPSGGYPPVTYLSFTISLDDVANDGVIGAGEGDNVHSDVEEITTSSGDDVIVGSAGAETFRAGFGADLITPGAGADVVFGERGADTINAVDGATDTIDCGRDTDIVNADLPGGQPASADVLNDCETIGGQAFAGLPAAAPLVLPAPTDTRKPGVKLGGGTQESASFLRNGQISVTVQCDEDCSAVGEVSTLAARIAVVGELSIGSGKLVSGSGKRTMTMTVAKRYRKALARKLRTKKQRRKGIKLAVRVMVTDTAGLQAVGTTRVSVKG